MNYTEELRKTKNFVLAHETINSKINQIQRKKYLKYEVYRKSKQWTNRHDEYDETMRTKSEN